MCQSGGRELAIAMTRTHRPTPTPSQQRLYDVDYLEWVNHTAELLKQGRLDELDIESLIEEVEDLGRSQKQALRSNLRVLLMHLLKWQYQSGMRTGSWKGSIREHRARIQGAIEDSPSLRNFSAQVLDNTYRKAREIASDETELDISTFPGESPYTVEQVLDDEFWPE